MKHLCYSKIIFALLFLASTLFAGLGEKSAVFYYGKDISYPTVGIHDYIVVEPNNTNRYTHGFSLYNEKIYARVVVKGRGVKNKVLRLFRRGYNNFFFDIKHIANEKEFIGFVNSFHRKHPNSKILLKDSYITQSLYNSIDGVVLENYLQKRNTISRARLNKIKAHKLDIIDIETMKASDVYHSDSLVKKLDAQGIIPYITNYTMDIYGKSSKTAFKREIFTLIDESKDDRIFSSAHQQGALIFEYMGYIQKLHDINKGLPDIDHMRHYAGVVVWLNVDYKQPRKLIRWVLELGKVGIKVVFADNFGSEMDDLLLKELGINVYDGDVSFNNKKHVVYKDDMMGFEIEPSLSDDSMFLQPNDSKPLLVYEDKNGLRSTPAAITPWGAYAISEAFMLELNDENIWIINPFKFFAEGLRLKKMLIPDPTTENGNRIFFTHVDGDGIMNGVESNPELYSGDILLEKILKPYKLPHSVSVIGAEIDDNGLYPKIAKRLQKIAADMYALPNVEPATHTFTHPFFWGKIKNGDLSPKYRLKPKGYKFSLDREIRGALEDINTNLLKKGSKKRAKTVYWSGDCIPTEMVLNDVYRKGILNINGGDTTISNASPWLSLVAPLGLGRGEYYQVYTGAQNENVFTNDWMGPFWGFKKVVQTFKLTNSPRRLKPIDVYYHIYSGSKAASINAVKYVLDWCLKQDILPMFTSEYIPKVMDFYAVSLANEGKRWLVEGMKDLKTLRFEKRGMGIDLENSKTVLGLKHFENHTYYSLDNHKKHLLDFTDVNEYKKEPYLISSNAKLLNFKNNIDEKSYSFDSHVNLKLSFHIPRGCSVSSNPKALKFKRVKRDLFLEYSDIKKAVVDVHCR